MSLPTYMQTITDIAMVVVVVGRTVDDETASGWDLKDWVRTAAAFISEEAGKVSAH